MTLPALEVINTAQPAHYSSRVIENRELSDRYYLLVLERPQGFQDPSPGTFIHLLVPDEGRFFLRRPFSIMDADDSSLSLMVVEKGQGTQIMRTLNPGVVMDLIGPLGSAFPRMPGKNILALGGGVGLAPLYYYDRHRQPDDCASYRLLYGARNRNDLFVDKYDWGKTQMGFSSDDGSQGFHGNVVEFAREEIGRSPADVIFSCGPNPMLKAVNAFANEVGLPLVVSLENRMACALGACRSCVVLTRDNDGERYRTVCNDGPVFDSATLVWDELPEA